MDWRIKEEIKNYNNSNISNTSHTSNTRNIILGYRNDNINMKIVKKVLKGLILPEYKNILTGIGINLPLENINMADLKYKASNIMNNEIVKLLLDK